MRNLLIATATVMFPVSALAEELIGTAANTALSVYEIAAAAISSALVWAAAWLAKKTKDRIKSTYMRGMLRRLNESVFEAVIAVNQIMPELIKKARDPKSQGGTAITKEEAEKLQNAAWDHVKSYWGKKGLKEIAKVAGFGGIVGIGKDDPGFEKMVRNKIEAAVGSTKAQPKNPQ